MSGAAQLPAAATDRLRGVPWRALAGLAPALDAVIDEILAGAAAERVVDRTLRALAPLDRAQRAAVAEALFGIGLWRLRIAYHLGERARDGDAPPGKGDPPWEVQQPPAGLSPSRRSRWFLAALIRDLGGVHDAEALVGLAAGTLPPPRLPPDDLATRYSLPAWLAETIVAEVGPEAPALADALALPGPICLRPNLLRIDAPSLARALAEEGVATRPGLLVPGALVVTSPRPNLHGLHAWREALFEVQDEASQLAGARVGAAPGETVLDLCAGAGGKTLQLAAAVGRAGSVHASDPDPERLARLARRAERAGAGGIVHVAGAAPAPDLRVDRVLVDAPCSELGALRRGPDQRFRIDPGGFPALERLQLEVLLRGADHVRPGGTLTYATCTFRRQEDEAVAESFTSERPQFVLRSQRRTWPHRDGADAFFVATWQLTR